MAKNNRNLLAFAPLIIFFGLIAMFAFGMWGNRISKDESPLIGKAAPKVQMETLDAQSLNIGGQTEKPIILNFFASWCAPCRAEAPALLQLAQSNEISVIGVAYRDDPKDTREFIAALGNPFVEIGIDRQGNTGALFGLSGVPETYIIDRSGVIVYKHKGAVAGSDVPKLIKIATLAK